MRWLDGITDSMDVSLSELRVLVIGRPGVLRLMGLQRVGHDWLKWTEWTCLSPLFSECPQSTLTELLIWYHLTLSLDKKVPWLSCCTFPWLSSYVTGGSAFLRLHAIAARQHSAFGQTVSLLCSRCCNDCPSKAPALRPFIICPVTLSLSLSLWLNCLLLR